jgi:hypothetical protein
MTLVPNQLKVQAAKQFCIRRIGYAKTQVHSMIVVERRISAKEGIIFYESAVSERIARGWIRLDGNADCGMTIKTLPRTYAKDGVVGLRRCPRSAPRILLDVDRATGTG